MQKLRTVRPGRVVSSLLVALACVIGPASGLAGAAATSTIEGRVAFEATGLPPAFGEVCAVVSGDLLPTCAPVDSTTGAYAITGLEAGEYRVFAHSTADEFVLEYLGGSYDEYSSTIATVGEDSTAIVDFAVAPGASVSGTVTHEGTGDPLAGIGVCVEGWPPRCTVTADDGTYSIGALPQLPTVISFALDADYGWVGEYWNNQVDPTNATSIMFDSPTESRAGIDAQLSRGGTIAGIVTDDETGLPLDTVEVCAYGISGAWSSCQTFDQTLRDELGLPVGGYRFTAVPADEYMLFFSSPTNYLAEFWDNQRAPGNARTVGVVGEDEVTADAALAPLHGVFGRVVDAGFGGAMPGARVCVYQQSVEAACTETDAYGTFAFPTLPAGTYTVGVPVQEGYFPHFWEGAISLDEATTFDVVDGVDNAPFELRLIQESEVIPGPDGEPVLTPEGETGDTTTTTTTTVSAPTTTSAVTTAPATTTSTTIASGAAPTTAPSVTTTTAVRVLGAQQTVTSPQARTGGSVTPMLLLAAAMFGAGAVLLLADRRRMGAR